MKRIGISTLEIKRQATQKMNQPSQTFGILIPGGVVRTDFTATDASGTKFALTLNGISGKDISTISELVFFLLPGISLPQDHGAML
jgi:hypothetical protein